MNDGRIAYWLTNAALAALILLGLGWELWLAPLRPGGSWLCLKVLPLLAPVCGIARGRRYTYQWLSMAILVYLAEGLLRSWTDSGTSQHLAVVEIVLSLLVYSGAICYVRATHRLNAG